MEKTPDQELLHHFARTNSGDTFAELVNRNVNLVYSTALRLVNGDRHLAQDVAQTVFTDLVRKAGSLTRRNNLAGWLYTSTHFAATKVVRGESRRRDREEKFMREPSNDTAPAADWEKVRPALDDAMHELREADREAIILRYFENRQFAEVGSKLGLNENAARMRVERALEKLRAILAKRGITPAATVASLISANAVQIAPTGFATILSTASLTAGGAGSFTLLKIMTATKLKFAISTVLVASAATAFVVQHNNLEKLRQQSALLQQQIARLQTERADLANQTATASGSSKLTHGEFNELLKLRGEIGALRQQTAELGQLRQENQHLQAMQLNADARQRANSDAQNQEHEAALRKLNDAKLGMLAFIMFADENQRACPTSFAQVVDYLGTNADLVGTNFDIAYQGSMSDIANPSGTIVLKEKRPWLATSGEWMKTYGFADGHSEIHTEPDGNFENYEKDHSALPIVTQ
jgi:RNA polymerase sigma factor (sigma-70 family)